jgi:hypothetical protein
MMAMMSFMDRPAVRRPERAAGRMDAAPTRQGFARSGRGYRQSDEKLSGQLRFSAKKRV